MSGGEVPAECDRVYKALLQCHRRVPSGPSRDAACRHLNRSLGECMINFICPDESSAVKTLCGNNKGTALKRSQCQQAQISLATLFIKDLYDDERCLVNGSPATCSVDAR